MKLWVYFHTAELTGTTNTTSTTTSSDRNPTETIPFRFIFFSLGSPDFVFYNPFIEWIPIKTYSLNVLSAFFFCLFLHRLLFYHFEGTIALGRIRK